MNDLESQMKAVENEINKRKKELKVKVDDVE